MPTFVAIAQATQSQAAASNSSPKTSGSRSALQFVDNRPEADAQRKLQGLSDYHPQAKQQKTIQKMVDQAALPTSTAANRNVAQLLPHSVVITGSTHLVEMGRGSIMKGTEQDGPELQQGDIVEIDPEVKHRSRRGPNQELNPSDEHGPHIYRWFKVLKVNHAPLKKNYFLRDGTFLTDAPEKFGGRPMKIHPDHRVRGQAPDKPFLVNERQAPWGKIVEVAPGIGVEILKGQSNDYATFIHEQIQKMLGTEVGTALISQFDPTGLGQPFRQVKDQTGPLKGITVLIGQPPASREPSKYDPQPNKGRVINTIEQGGITSTGKKSFETPSIPRINFFDRPLGKAKDQIGDTTAEVTNRGIEKHDDFPHQVQSFDIVLFHELVHAYLSQIGVARRLRELGDEVTNTLPALTEEPDTIEEQLVVGLAGGAGRYLSENRYRMEQREQSRGTYRAVHLHEDSDRGTMKTWLDGVSIKKALQAAGLTAAQAAFVAGGH